MNNEITELREIQLLGKATASSTFKPQQSERVCYYIYPESTENSRITTVPSSTQPLPVLKNSLIDEYFRLSPINRATVRKRTVAQIKSVSAVFAVLDWSLRGDIANSYDAAVDLLAECGDVLVKSIEYFNLENLRLYRSSNQIDSDTKLDVLINGIARASKLSAATRLKVIIQLSSSKSRMVKAAIIDAAVLLVNQKNKKPISTLLTWFASSKEADDYVRRCAEEALAEIYSE
jgi:hypothetical protein